MRAKILRGQQTVWRSVVPRPHRKLHLDPVCEGLEDTPGIEDLSFRSVRGLLKFDEGRPCRMCALESVLYTALREGKHKVAPRKVFATFSAQGVAGEPGTRVSSYQWGKVSVSGRERLLRVAKRFKLGVGHSAAGPIAYGFLSEAAVDVLRRNLRTYVLEKVEVAPKGATVEAFWALINDAPPELGGGDIDPWDTAVLVTA